MYKKIILTYSNPEKDLWTKTNMTFKFKQNMGLERYTFSRRSVYEVGETEKLDTFEIRFFRICMHDSD